MRIAQMIVAFVLFTVVMTVVGLFLKDAVPPFHAWATENIGRGGVAAIIVVLMVAGGAYAYRAEIKARRSDRSF